MKTKIMYSVYVGGLEVNENYLTLDQADILALDYLEDGYEDIFIKMEYVYED